MSGILYFFGIAIILNIDTEATQVVSDNVDLSVIFIFKCIMLQT